MLGSEQVDAVKAIKARYDTETPTVSGRNGLNCVICTALQPAQSAGFAEPVAILNGFRYYPAEGQRDQPGTHRHRGVVAVPPAQVLEDLKTLHIALETLTDTYPQYGAMLDRATLRLSVVKIDEPSLELQELHDVADLVLRIQQDIEATG